MSLQKYPICWECEEPVEHSAVYEAICGHDNCPSSVFHGICLMQWRDKREEIDRQVRHWLSQHPMFQRPEEN